MKKSTICSRRGQYQALRNKEKRVFRDYLYERFEAQLPLVPRTPDLAFFVATTTDIWQTVYTKTPKFNSC